MQSAFILALYLGDEIISVLMPFSSGPFTLLLVALLLSKVRVRPAVTFQLLAWSLFALVVGTVGALLSGTPVTAFSAMTIALLAAVWAAGSGLHGRDAALMSPRSAFVGVMVGVVFLVASLLGWDAFSAFASYTSGRGAGLFAEPSHLALYEAPLFMIASRRKVYQPWLGGALLLFFVTCFSSSLAATFMIAVGLHAAIGQSKGSAGRRVIQWALAVAVIAALPLPLQVTGVPIQEYIGSRLSGLFVNDNTESFNLSSLVLLQGLELARISFIDSWGLGVGLGNLGTSMPVVEQSFYRTLINSVTADHLDLNLRDGGLLVSKVVGEMGVLALGLAWLVVQHVRRLRNVVEGEVRTYHIAFAAVMLSVLFVRAMPYFAAPTCLAMVSMASLLPWQRRRRRAPPAGRPGPVVSP